MFRRFRILILCLVLVFVGLGAWLDDYYVRRWTSPVVVALFPINADGSDATRQYIESLQTTDFEALESFFADEALEYKLRLAKPVRFVLAPALGVSPPQPPTNHPSVLEIMLWSLHLRWWAWRTPPNPPGPTPRVRLFLQFHDPKSNPVLKHSTGISKGRLGIVNLFAQKNASGSNQAIVAHELLHTLGATDKYDLRTNQPSFPTGYAEPDRVPRYPQRFAEVMGGRVPLSPEEARIPERLSEVIIGPTTADEISWLKN